MRANLVDVTMRRHKHAIFNGHDVFSEALHCQRARLGHGRILVLLKKSLALLYTHIRGSQTTTAYETCLHRWEGVKYLI